jgi:protein SCO1/2
MRLPLTWVFACALALLGCDQLGRGAAGSQFKNTDITGLEYARDFALPDFNGKPRTLADFKGKAVVIFFGYTQCPDVCPTTMSDLAAAMQQLGPLADRVQVLFISVDPERDKPEFLAQYVPNFDPRFLGLVGNRAQTDAVIKEFRVFYQKVPGKEPGSYSVDHTASSFVFDPHGRIRLLIMPGQGAGPIAHDLKILLSS